MPWIEYSCRKCGHEFRRLSEKRAAEKLVRCPKCGDADVAAMPSAEPLFGGIAGFSRLSKDTN